MTTANKNGLKYEKLTDLSDRYEIISVKNKITYIQFNDNAQEFVYVSNTKLYKYMSKIGEKNNDIKPAHGCKLPDEAFINPLNKKLYIIEKKFQQVKGSVCEKIQTAHFKKYHYKKMFPNFEVEYIYCLSDWFKENCEAELEYLKEINIPVFWGSDKEYKTKIINFICS